MIRPIRALRVSVINDAARSIRQTFENYPVPDMIRPPICIVLKQVNLLYFRGNLNRNILGVESFGAYGKADGTNSLERANHYHSTAIVCL